MPVDALGHVFRAGGKIFTGIASSAATIACAARSGIRRASPSSNSSSMCHHGESHFGQYGSASRLRSAAPDAR